MKSKIMTLKKDTLVIIPNRPNFISLDGIMQPLSQFSEDELQMIGLQWVKLLKIKREKQVKNNERNHDS